MKKDTKPTREEVPQIIRKHLIKQIPRDFEIQDGIPAGCNFYDAERLKKQPCWVAWIPSGRTMVGPSRIICISKKTGRIIYDGLSNEE